VICIPASGDMHFSKEEIMRKFVIFTFLVLIFICSCSGNKDSASYWFDKAMGLWNGSRYSDPEKAVEYYTKAIDLQKNNAELYNNRGTAYYNLEQYVLALDDFNKAINLKKDFVDAYNNRGGVFFMLGQHEAAIADFNKAISLKKDYADAYNNRGVVYISQGKKKPGISDLRKACELGNCTILNQAKAEGLCN
jgi:tetratricopeptide (TPR) repeat protein